MGDGLPTHILIVFGAFYRGGHGGWAAGEEGLDHGVGGVEGGGAFGGFEDRETSAGAGSDQIEGAAGFERLGGEVDALSDLVGGFLDGASHFEVCLGHDFCEVTAGEKIEGFGGGVVAFGDPIHARLIFQKDSVCFAIKAIGFWAPIIHKEKDAFLATAPNPVFSR